MTSLSRSVGVGLALLAFMAPSLYAQDSVRVWLGEMVLPTYAEGPPDINPPFEFFEPARINYPYTLRTNLTDQRHDRTWRAAYLENRYLRCSVLPDLGGHLYSCTDKLSGEEMFYANPSIKLSQIGYRGAWAALGIEFNYPVSHNWVSTSPVAFATVRNPDGSASVWVGNTDRVVGTRWRVELRLHPGRASLEQHTTLYNPSAYRHRYYWWTNAAVEVWEDSRILYPQRFTASHGFTDVDTWPVDRRGTDNSVLANQIYGPVSRFSHGSREPFMAVYHPRTDAGTVHWSDPAHLPAKKFWSWGVDARAMAWRRALSDDNSAYVEIQAGLFRNQETYEFMAPQGEVRFSETWIPVRGLGGVTRATPDAVLHLERDSDTGTVRLRLNAAARFEQASWTVTQAADTLDHAVLDLDPEIALDRSYSTDESGERSSGPVSVSVPVSVTVKARDGRTLLRHVEGVFDMTPDSLITPGPQSVWAPPKQQDAWSAEDYLAVGDSQERDGRRLRALATYQDGVHRFPESLGLTRRLGVLLAALDRPAEAVPLLERVLNRISTDAESWYHLGMARLALGDPAGARLALEQAQLTPEFRTAALIELAGIVARAGDLARALSLLEQAINGAPGSLRAHVGKVALLRRDGRIDAARTAHEYARNLDPVLEALRYEGTQLGTDDPSLPSHLAGDPERVVSLARMYLNLGMEREAEFLLTAGYPEGATVHSEPGQARPSNYALLHYYAAFVARARPEVAGTHLQRARSSPARYVFPNHAWDRRVLEWAVAQDSEDALALHLLASLRLAGGRPEAALELWARARTLEPDLPALHRNMGRTVLQTGGDPSVAVAYLSEGLQHDSRNVDLYLALDTALVLSERPAEDRTRAVLSFPDLESAPAPFVFHAARVLSQTGRHQRAAELFEDRFFPSEEGGTDPRAVYLGVRLAQVRALVDAGECRRARDVAARVLEPGAQITFADARYRELLGSESFAALHSLPAGCAPARP